VSIAGGPDGNLWFTAPGVGSVGSIAPDGTFGPLIPVGGYPYGIASGPDGNLWISDSNHPRIDRVTTAGVVTRFPITGGGYHSSTDITAGPDGNLWFTDPGANALGMITTAGAVQEFALPTESAYPFDIAAGSDGAMWFTEFSAGKIGRITV
jgi:virginiamycin B lyase